MYCTKYSILIIVAPFITLDPAKISLTSASQLSLSWGKSLLSKILILTLHLFAFVSFMIYNPIVILQYWEEMFQFMNIIITQLVSSHLALSQWYLVVVAWGWVWGYLFISKYHGLCVPTTSQTFYFFSHLSKRLYAPLLWLSKILFP